MAAWVEFLFKTNWGEGTEKGAKSNLDSRPWEKRYGHRAAILSCRKTALIASFVGLAFILVGWKQIHGNEWIASILD